MSGASFQEVFLLIVIGLVVLGPKRLPQVANQLGSWLGQARRMTRMMKRQLEDEINFDLDEFNVEKQLGLDDKPKSTAKPTVGQPAFVQDRNPASRFNTEDDVGDSTDHEDDVETAELAELPDDYSPAHGADEAGTGVGDDDPLEVPDGADALAANEAVAENDTGNDTSVVKPKSETA